MVNRVRGVNEMITRLAMFIGLFVFFITAFCSPFYGVAASPIEKEILIMLPHTPDFPAHATFREGLKIGFQQDSQFKIKYSYEYLGLANYVNDESYLADTAKYFQAKYMKRQPDLIIAGGELAHFFTMHGNAMFPGVPIILPLNRSGMLDREVLARFGFIRWSDANFYERNIEIILQTRPFTQKIYIVVGDSDEERRIVGQLERVISQYDQKIEFSVMNKLSSEQMLKPIRNAGEDSAVLFIRWTTDAEGENFIPAQVLQRICREAKIPVYATSVHLLGSGIVGGFLRDFEMTGRNMAELGLRALHGEKISGIYESVLPVQYAFDWRQLKKWGIDQDKLPQNSKIEYREYSAWELYKSYIIGAIVLIILETGLVFALLINLVRRRKAENELMRLNMSQEERIFVRTQELMESNDQLKATKEQLEELNCQLDLTSRTDSLTGLYNRRHLEEKILEEYERYLGTGAEFAVAIADIDFFKNVNDNYGHDIGDCLLKSISEDIKKQVRKYDTIARWGGEEFLLLLPTTNLVQAVELAERIRRTIEDRKYTYENRVLSVTVTVGVSIIGSSDAVDAIFKKADIALYHGKRAGRNCVIAFDNIAGRAMQ